MCLLPYLLARVEKKRQRRAAAAGVHVAPPPAALDAAAVPPGDQKMDAAAAPVKPPVQFDANEATNPMMLPLRYWRCGKLCASPAERHAHVLQASTGHGKGDCRAMQAGRQQRHACLGGVPAGAAA